MARIGFTGTQKGMSPGQKEELIWYLHELAAYPAPIIFHHGDCIGADEDAHLIAKRYGAKVHIHPPFDSPKRAHCHGDVTHNEKENLARNRDIVDACDVLIAAPDGDHERLRSGTWSTVRYARRKGKAVRILIR
jgi:nucleoside 2-deoxyribosyltransferase